MDGITITELSHHHVSDHVIERLNALLLQLTHRAKPIDTSYLKSVLDQPDVYVYAAMEGETIHGILIGIVALTLLRKTMYLEEMVVDEVARGKGLGKSLLETAITKAKELRVKEMDLTSNNSRTAAIALYESMGFQKRDTNAFRLLLEDEPSVING